LHLLWSWC